MSATWINLVPLQVKINVDASFFENERAHGICAVI
jgi:hypothetical protein